MKKLKQFAIFGALLYSMSIVGCTKDLSDDIDDLKNRVSLLEEQTKQINNDIANINDVVNAINESEQITEVKELTDKSGYEITFSKDGKVTRTIEIKHGSKGEPGEDAPVIGTAIHPELNVFCWNQTINGVTKWLTDSAGDPIPLTGSKGENATAPQIGVDAQGYWTIDLKNGSGVKRMKDANGNDVKAVGKDGASGALGFSLSPDERYAIFTISGKEYKFEISAITIGFDNYGIIYVEPSDVKTLNIILPGTLKKSDFTAISAKIEGKNTDAGSSDVVTRATAGANWIVNLTKPTYNDQTIATAPIVEITAPLGAVVGQAAVLTVTLTLSSGQQISSSRAVEIAGRETDTYPTTGTEYILATAIGDTPKNADVTVGTNLTTAQTFTIPNTYTKDNTPVITLKFNSNINFTINDAVATTLTIDATNYDGMIVVEGTGNTHTAIVNSGSDGKALKVNAPNATVIVQNIQITGSSDIAASPTTFVVRKATIGATSVTSGSVQIDKESTVASLVITAIDPVIISGTITGNLESSQAPLTIQAEALVQSVTLSGTGSIEVQKDATITSTIESTSDQPIVISGTVEGKVTSESSVEVKDGAKTNEIEGAGVTVAEGARVEGDLTSNGDAPVEVKGAVTGSVRADDAGKVEIGENAKIDGDLTTNDNADVTLPPTANIGGDTNIPVSSANISIGNQAYGTLSKAFAAVQDNDIIAIKTGEYDLEPTDIDKTISIKGAGRDLTIIKGELSTSKSLTIEDLHINVESAKAGVGAVNITASDVTLTTDNFKITQNKAGSGDGTSASGLGILVKSGTVNTTLNLMNTDIILTKKYQRGIAFPHDTATGSGVKIDMDNCNILCPIGVELTDSPATYSQGLGLAGLISPVVNIRNCRFEGMYYPINCAGSAPDGMTLTIENSVLTGFCALNLRGKNMTITVSGGSVLTGKNLNPKGSNDFGAIIFDRNVASDNTLNVENSTIKAFANNTSLQYPIDVRGNENITINLKGSSKLIDEVLDPAVNLDYLIEELGTGCKVTKESTVTIIGKEGVLLYKGYVEE